ncbi:DUF3231 family protein [Paenibacillus sp. GD4]|uniref:DUF3231 family protein n=1 Tax=Paenibacillus sp. GD4 TaxID=3068890 RepID=UPI0027969E2B|nr:DUF3231 family protein [Paenibacillus sp. GD4]MDQ1912810.1 DUF3231 family protein [Paenibacillus sp. GD4]
MAQTEHNIRLTSSEIAQLWSGYMGDSMSRCVLSYFMKLVEDEEIRQAVQYALHLSEQHLQTITTIFENERFPIPHGFTDKDVNVGARRLFSDTFMLVYLRNVAKQGLSLYGMALAVSARTDVRAYFSECLASVTELYNKAAGILLSKGLYIRSPYLPTPESAEYVQKESFLNGFFGDKRPLNALEISHFYSDIQTNALGKALITGFAQTAQSAEVKHYFLRGKDLAQKQLEVFSSYLKDDDLPAPMTWDSDVLDSTEPPFSEKLMLFHITGLNAAGVLNYGTAISVAMRRDVVAAYTRLMTEILTYAEDGAKLLIDNGWMEKTPGTVDRDALAAKG